MAKKPKMRKMKGTFCEELLVPKKDFDSRSFRWKKSGQAWLLVGCDKKVWQPKKRWKLCRTVNGQRRCLTQIGKCKTGTKAHKILRLLQRKRCPVGTVRISKG